MKHVMDSVRRAVDDRNWYAALALALTLPDACAHAEGVQRGRGRYVDWCARYLVPMYTRQGHPERNPIVVMLTGDDCYALRCAYLHSGEFDVDDDRGRAVISRFMFTMPAPGSANQVHKNRFNDVLQLQVDRFCAEMCEAVQAWLVDVENDAEIQARIAKQAAVEILG